MTPITAYLDANPGESIMSLAKDCGLHNDTVKKAASGKAPPAFVTLLKLQQGAGIPVMAWASTEAVKALLAKSADPEQYAGKQRRWRNRRRS